ncbi:MAG TPA: type I-U CRISPR-associated RAMP protein Csb1/Cas7u [Acidimicrobiales bacterium]|jgi:CRISPR-associated protein Csb1|nr:type I-U CRISPR-associated RAMP protein Csb1/Cas7u [Acidimicrobiales bacterium]
MTITYGELRDAVALATDRAVIRVRTIYEASGGPGARLFPPTYPKDGQPRPYVVEERTVDGAVRQDVLLDSVASQANRAEETLLRAQRAGRIAIPLMEIHHDGASQVILTSLELPHRYADAYLLDSEIDGVKFDKTELGRAFQAASLEDATVLLRHDPGSVVFGAWNSHRKGRQAKFPRIYSSELVGWDPQFGARRAGRMDPLNLTGLGRRDEEGALTFTAVGEKAKGEKLSEIGHGNIAPGEAHGGVTVSLAERFATVSLSGLDRVGFGAAPYEAAVAARATIAAYALLADRLAFSGPALWLRSGCDLVTTSEVLEWVGRGGKVEPFTLSAAEAISLYEEATSECGTAGMPLVTEPVRLVPGKGLRAAIDFALTRAETTGE